MSLETKITDALKVAMKEKDKVALESLRAIKSQLLLLKTDGKTEEISPEQEIALLQRLVKQRKEAYEQFKANNRNELAENEQAQSKVIEQFLPAQLSPEELEKELKAIIEETGAQDIKDLGKVMGAATKKLQGKAEGKAISETVRKLLS
ncbi:MAG: GatB/YqeY domain-containing protein [Flavobacteriaceae bacterium]|jgi:uncharacterized protein YqeY|nr:GatB/YqeY domain-containing protein [Flavobacteriaceae bacterium]